MADEVYNRIAMLRVERGISRRQLADALGVHYQTVGYLERGEFAPSLHLALRLARFFGVPVEVIFSIEPFPRIGQSAPAAEVASPPPADDGEAAQRRTAQAGA